MSFMHRMGIWLACTWIILAFAGIGNVAAHGVSLNFYTPFPPDSAFHGTFVIPWAQTVEKDAGGRMRFHLHPGSDASSSDLLKQLLDGDVDVAWLRIEPSSENFRALAIGLTKLPMAGSDADLEASSRSLWEYVVSNDLLYSDFGGMRVLAIHYCHIGPRTDASESPGVCLLAMSIGSFRSLSDDLKEVITANSGANTAAWLTRATGQTVSENKLK